MQFSSDSLTRRHRKKLDPNMAININISDGSIEPIHMKEGETAEAVATRFCQDQHLPEQFVGLLAEHIVEKGQPTSCYTKLYPL